MLFGIGLIAAIGCSNRNAHSLETPQLTLFVAASLTDVIQEIGAHFEALHSVELIYNFASSGTLAQQIKASPQADLFLSANQTWMNTLDSENLLLPGSNRIVAHNQLVLVAHPAADYALHTHSSLPQLSFKWLAIGHPDYVPAGQYARAWLESQKDANGTSHWETLQKRLSFTHDVRAVSAQVESQQTIVGILYVTDYLLRPEKLALLAKIPLQETPSIHYSAAIIKTSSQSAVAQDFLNYLQSPAAQEIFSKYGFPAI